MHLGHHRDLPVGQTLDRPELPQRTLAVQGLPGDVPAGLGEFLPATRRRHRRAVQVTVDVEVRIIDPHRMVHVERGVVQLAAKRRRGSGTEVELVLELVEGVAAGHRGRVENQQPAHVQQLCRGFQIEEAGVETAEAFHLRDVSRKIEQVLDTG